jgi:Tfp pilus assembly protein PilN
VTTININLLGIEQKARFRSGGGLSIDRGWLVALVAVGAGLVIAIGGTLTMNGLVASAEENKATLEGEIQALEAQLGEVKNIQAKKDVAQAEQRILEYVTGKTYAWSRFLNEVRDLTPDTMWIEGIGVTGEVLTLSGNTFDHQTVAFFVANLQASPLLTDVTLTNSSKTITKEGSTSVHFTLSAKMKYDVAPASDEAAVPTAAAPAAENKTMGNDAAANAARGKAALRGGAGKAAMQVGG